MPQVIETVVYPISELCDSAKDAARAWYRQHCMDHAWYDFVYEDFQTVCTILGIELRTSPARLAGGATREQPHIYWTGFWAQGDGACYEGTYSYARSAAASIRIHAPLDTRLHAIADSLQAVQRRNFYQCHARIEHHGRYYHEYSMAISAERDSPTWQPMTAGAEDTIAEALRDLARWLYRQLESEYQYQTSDEAVGEILAINGFTFTGDGERFGRTSPNAAPNRSISTTASSQARLGNIGYRHGTRHGCLRYQRRDRGTFRRWHPTRARRRASPPDH